MTEVSTGLMGRCEARVGRTLLGKWRLDQLIDVGGMAAVYAATHRNGNRVAVKILHPELAHIGDLRERFLKEGYVANKIRHRGAVRMLDDDAAEDGSAFIVMELLEGETLHTRMLRHGGRIPVDDLLCIIDKVLEVLVAAHGEQILHRDIKPANIFITLGADVKLLDFGIARVREAAGGIRAPTLPGTVLGTPGFIPPEQALGRMEELDASSDVWAVGATMFAALTGRCVHEAETVNEQIVLAATTPAPPIRSVASSVPGPVATVIDRALAFRKTYRYDSATAMQAAVQETFHQLQGYRISRGEQMAHVVAELRDLYESGDDSPDEHTTVPKRKWPLRATEPERESEVLAAVEAARRAPSTAPLPGTIPVDRQSEAPAPRPSRSNVQATVPAFPIKQHLTPEGIVAPSPKRPPPQTSLLSRISLRAAIFAAPCVRIVVTPFDPLRAVSGAA